jgi:hypothetical protein
MDKEKILNRIKIRTHWFYRYFDFNLGYQYSISKDTLINRLFGDKWVNVSWTLLDPTRFPDSYECRGFSDYLSDEKLNKLKLLIAEREGLL